MKRPDHTPRCQANERQAFTRIEQPVVIASITILASLLLPALSRARDMAQYVGWLRRQTALQHGCALLPSHPIRVTTHPHQGAHT